MKLVTVFAMSSLALAGCGGDQPTDEESTMPLRGTMLTVGTQDYYTLGIIGEVYSQALEHAGYTVERRLTINSQSRYMDLTGRGILDLSIGYSGQLLRYWEPGTAARSADEITEKLRQVTPSLVRLMTPSTVTDQEVCVVTRQFADQWNLVTVSDLAHVTVPMVIGGNAEALSRLGADLADTTEPAAPPALLNTYGVETTFKELPGRDDQLAIQALQHGEIQIADVHRSNPLIAAENLVVLEDPDEIFSVSRIVSFATLNIDQAANDLLDRINATLTTDDLMMMNQRYLLAGTPVEVVATDWLRQHQFI
jgi:osmoprotectant transport system substrate-binding protein